MDNYNEFLSNLLKSGVTPEKVYQDALQVLQEQQRQQEKDKKLNTVRDTLIQALYDYLSIVAPKAVDKDPTAFAENLETSLKALEPNFEDIVKMNVKVGKMEIDEFDKIFEKFFKRYGL